MEVLENTLENLCTRGKLPHLAFIPRSGVRLDRQSTIPLEDLRT